MILKFAVLEGFAVLAAVYGAGLASTTVVLNQWSDVAFLLTQALAVTLCCVVSFYYNDLYNFRIVRTFGEFAVRLIQAFGVALILLAALYAVFTPIRMSTEPFLTGLIVILAVLLPYRGQGHGAALVRALEAGHLAGAGLDVFESEPAVHPGLLASDRVVLMPHAGSATQETRREMARMVVEDVRRVLSGEKPVRPVPLESGRERLRVEI